MLRVDAVSPVPVDFSPEGVFVLESRHGRGFRMDDIAHDFLKILYAFQGKGFLVHHGRRPMGRGDVAVVPPGARHRLEDSGESPLCLYGICIRQDFFARAPTDTGIPGNVRVFRHPVWAGELSGLLRTLLVEQSHPAPGRGAWVLGLTWQIVALACRAEATTPARSADTSRAVLATERVRAYARDLPHTFHKETTLDEAAQRLGLSRRRFTQLFREATGGTWLEAVRALRIGHARRLLRDTNRSVAAIAFEAGFADLSHFYRVFRGLNGGASPLAWRQRQQAGSLSKRRTKRRRVAA